ncbi:hypothetical protein ARMSODRAFT_983823 [Armillaria solidipes]|uniref:Uncharacterized protein n=1 Tax=Armillaria solidipes TaxID=1076256 RepID=A0A2H3AHK3_9AGAR|nr:hypothetical protein ARMSODRAFT_983823 [Armillaria solidipes]
MDAPSRNPKQPNSAIEVIRDDDTKLISLTDMNLRSWEIGKYDESYASWMQTVRRGGGVMVVEWKQTWRKVLNAVAVVSAPVRSIAGVVEENYRGISHVDESYLERGATITERVTYIFHVLPPGVSPLYGSIDDVGSLLIYLKIGSEVLQVSRGDGKDEKSGEKRSWVKSGFTGPSSGTLSLTTMTDSLSLSNLNTERLYALLTILTEKQHQQRFRFAIPLKFGVDDNDAWPVDDVVVNPGLPSAHCPMSLHLVLFAALPTEWNADGNPSLSRARGYPGSWGRLIRWKSGHVTDPEEHREHDILPPDRNLTTKHLQRIVPKPQTPNPSRRRWQSSKMRFLLGSFPKSLLSVVLTYTLRSQEHGAGYRESFSGLAVRPHPANDELSYPMKIDTSPEP